MKVICQTIQRSIGLFNNWIRTSYYARRKKYFHHNYTKKHFEELFEADFHKSVRKYNKEFKKISYQKDKELYRNDIPAWLTRCFKI